MALTKSDLQQIGNVIDERLERRLTPIEKDIGDVSKDITGLKQDVGAFTKDIKYLKKKVNKMAGTVDLIGRNYDEGDVKLAKRVRRIEEHLDLPRNNN